MKKLILPIAILFSLHLHGQEEETVFNKTRVHGGFGAPIVEYTSMDDQAGVLVGGGGAIIIDDFFFGGFGQGGSFAEHVVGGREYPLNFGYGGLWLGYVKPTVKAIHFFSSVKIAGGSISISEDRDDFEDTLYDETVFVVQPEAGVELNLFKWFRIALTGNYRIVSGIQSKNLGGLSNKDFNSGGMTLTLRFGKFYRENR